MGTNYYFERITCDKCLSKERLHIGKSSMGWMFALREQPEYQIHTLQDWVRFIAKAMHEAGPANDVPMIVDEYGRDKSLPHLLCTIMNRSCRNEHLPKRDPHRVKAKDGSELSPDYDVLDRDFN